MGLSTASLNYCNPRSKEVPALNATALRGLGTLGRAQLIGQDRLSYDVLDRDLQLNLEGDRFPDWLLPVGQLSDPAVFFAQLASGKSLHPFRNAKDYDDFLKRMAGLVVVLEQAISNMCEGMKANVVQPKAVMEKVAPSSTRSPSSRRRRALIGAPSRRCRRPSRLPTKRG